MNRTFRGRQINGPAPIAYQPTVSSTSFNPASLPVGELQRPQVYQQSAVKKIRLPKVVNSSLPPCQTIYINNLNEKIKIEDMQKALRAVFNQFGVIEDIIAMKSVQRKGQAYISFEELESAENALKSMQGFPLFQKPLRIEFAKTMSDRLAKKLNKYKPRPPKPPRPSKQARKQIFADQQQSRQAAELAARNANPLTAPMTPIFQFSDTAPPPPPPSSTVPVGQPTVYGNNAPPPVTTSKTPPNNILFIERLPPESNELMISVLFNQFVGYKEVRLVPGRADIAFVEFETIEQSAIARSQLNNFKVTPTHALRVSFAKQ